MYRRLVLVDVESRGENPIGVEGLRKCRFVDDRAPSGVDQNCRGLHQSDSSWADQVIGVLAKRDVDGDHVGCS